MMKIEMSKIFEKVGDTIISVLTAMVFLLLIFLALYAGYSLRHEDNRTIEEQHQDLMLDGDYIYCPYCGKKLEK